jgi:hypothetical protein
MSTNAEIQKRLRAAETATAAKAAAAKKAAIEKKAAEDRARKAEADRQRRKYGKAANEAFEVWQQSPAGIATLQSQRAADKTRGVAGIVSGENQERAETDAQIERNRKAFVNARIARDVRNEGKPTGTNTSGSNRGSVPTNGSGKQGTGSGKQGTSTAAEPDDLKNPTAFKDKDRAATDFDNNNPFKGQNTTEDRTFSNNRYSAGRFDINSFRSKVVGYDGVLSTHSFLVVFSPMDWVPLKAIRNEIFPDLTMRCDNAILPTINLLQEQNVRRYGFGPVENVAYGVNVGDFTLQFIVDKQASIIDFFESWMNLIVNRDSFGGANMNNVVGDNKRPYEVAYKDTYACPSVNVFVYDRAQNTVLEYNIYDVFPTGIQSMNLSWSEENSLMKLNVTFSFTDVRIRSKESNFDNDSFIPFSEMLNYEPISISGAGDLPLSDTNIASILDSLPSDQSLQPLIIGGGNKPPSTFRAPIDTDAAPPTNTVYEVPAAANRDGFGNLLNYT